LNSDDDLPQRESKSQRKRDMLALQDIGKTLVELPAAQLAKIPLEPPLAEAISEARLLTSHGAIRRQLQYIGKLMRNIDPTPIQAALADLDLKSQQSKAQFHQIERWRDRLIAEDDTTLQVFIDQHPDVDRQQLRQFVRNAKKSTKAHAELFRFLRTILS
jgi:ribosome-associated protein